MTDDTLYARMQDAVDIVANSPHPANKIAATVAGADGGFALSLTNSWPEPIDKKIGRATRIGNSSGTIHAETACLIHAPGPVKNGALFVTDPPCPNCVKNMAEAGIKTLYIDHKGFDKDFAQRRGHHFTSMSMRICEKAGISVYEIWRKEKKLVPILEVPENYTPPLENASLTESAGTAMDHASFAKHVEMRAAHYQDKPFAVAAARDKAGAWFVISAETHPVIGYTSEMPEDLEGKYNVLLQPVNRVIMTAARRGLTIDPAYLYSSIVPTARELVNMTGAGLNKIAIGDINASRDAFGPAALKQLQNAGILDASN
jgi:dCMP deaminase